MRQRLLAAATGALFCALAACAPRPQANDSVSQAQPAEVAAAPGSAPIDGPTLKTVRERGRVACGVADELPGFSARDVLGQWRGFDIDVCRAVAAAVLGDARLVRIEPMGTRARYAALQSAQIDLIPRGSWNFSRDAGLALDFVGVSYYDTQGFLVSADMAGRTVDDLAGLMVCVQAGTANELNLVEHFAGAPVDRKPELLMFETVGEALEAYRDGRCRALSGDISVLSSQRTLLRDPDNHAILPGAISKEPQGPVVRQSDGQWADVVGWTLNAMILAEEFDISSRNVGTARTNPSRPEIGRLLRDDEDYGRMLLLENDWAFQIIRQVGNYGEVFNRHLGPDTPLALERGQNAMWNADVPGLLYAPPMR